MLSFLVFYRPGHTRSDNPRRASKLCLVPGSSVPTEARNSHELESLRAGLAGKGNRRSELSLTPNCAWLLSCPPFLLIQQGTRSITVSGHRLEMIRSGLFPWEDRPHTERTELPLARTAREGGRKVTTCIPELEAMTMWTRRPLEPFSSCF